MDNKSATRRRAIHPSRLKVLALATVLGVVLAVAAAVPALAAYGLNNFAVTFTNADGSPANQAGSHPFAMTTSFNSNFSGETPDGDIKDLNIEEVAGFVGNATAVPRCSAADFLDAPSGEPKCNADTAVGQIAVTIQSPTEGSIVRPVYNLERPPGVVTRFGFNILNVEVTIDVGVKGSPEYNVIAPQKDLPQALSIFSAKFQLWGNPESPAHDHFRGPCGSAIVFGKLASEVEFPPSENSCPVSTPEKAFLTLPTSCRGSQMTRYTTASWQEPTKVLSGETETSGFTGCGKLRFNPSITTQPTSRASESPTGLDFSLDVKDDGLVAPEGLAQSAIRKAVVTLPEGMTANPALAEGLNICSEGDLERETLGAAPGAGCPEASKIGTVEVETPLLEEPIDGALFVAKPYENPFGSLLALYIVVKSPKLGVIIKQAANVERDPRTGRLTTVVENIPQLPFSHFRLHFREGARSPLSSPPTCGRYSVEAVLTPWSGGAPLTTTSTFEVSSGANGTPCSSATPPFHPFIEAGTVNNAAGHYSPFNVRLNRKDGEQEITRFSIKLPRGVIGKLAGIPFCSEAAIAAAKARTGSHGGQEEIDNPSCPPASAVGRSLAGAGVGPSLAYAPGKFYLAGPYHGSALSLVSVTAAKVGPFDLGTVVVRFALKVDPETADVSVDAAGSDPIPRILAGIPVHLRDVRGYVDRPDFVLNPTSCNRTSTTSSVLGSGASLLSEADDLPVTVSSPFQAASCASLGFAPKLALSLRGGTRRGDTPRLRAVLTYPKKGSYANIASARVTLPHSEFLEQGHIRTVCTRVQFAAGGGNGERCPAASIYGRARAVTPLLDEPLRGPVYLRSSSHPLPDLVVALHSGKIDINLVGRIDSIGNGRIRNTFAAVPDAPVSKFVLEMQGGRKGLLVNSANLCKSTERATAAFRAQNGRALNLRPILKARCGHKKAKR
jgi:hypothetical protein